MEYLKMIDEIERDIYQLKFEKMHNHLDNVVNWLQRELENLSSNNILMVNSSLQKLMIAYENEDYVLFVDIIKYEIIDIIR